MTIMWKYTNGRGHLIMSIAFTLVAAVMILWPSSDATMRGYGFGLLATVSGYWFVTSSAESIARAVVKDVNNEAQPPAPKAP